MELFVVDINGVFYEETGNLEKETKRKFDPSNFERLNNWQDHTLKN